MVLALHAQHPILDAFPATHQYAISVVTITFFRAPDASNAQSPSASAATHQLSANNAL